MSDQYIERVHLATLVWDTSKKEFKQGMTFETYYVSLRYNIGAWDPANKIQPFEPSEKQKVTIDTILDKTIPVFGQLNQGEAKVRYIAPIEDFNFEPLSSFAYPIVLINKTNKRDMFVNKDF